jgi:hypothetical protein
MVLVDGGRRAANEQRQLVAIESARAATTAPAHPPSTSLEKLALSATRWQDVVSVRSPNARLAGASAMAKKTAAAKKSATESGMKSKKMVGLIPFQEKDWASVKKIDHESVALRLCWLPKGEVVLVVNQKDVQVLCSAAAKAMDWLKRSSPKPMPRKSTIDR